MGLPAIFFAPHQDDELLQMGVEIGRHVSVGRPVTVIVAGDGAASTALGTLNGTGSCAYHGFTHDPAAEGRGILTGAQMGAARNNETRSSCAAMKVSEVVFAGRAEDGLTEAIWRELLLENESRTAGGASVFVPTPWESALNSSGIPNGNPDHGNAGKAMQQLRAEGHYADSAGVWVAYTVWSRYWSTPGCPTGLTRGPNPGEEQARMLAAADAYRAWSPQEGALGIGWCHSVAADFNAQFVQTSNPRYLQGRYHT